MEPWYLRQHLSFQISVLTRTPIHGSDREEQEEFNFSQGVASVPFKEGTLKLDSVNEKELGWEKSSLLGEGSACAKALR